MKNIYLISRRFLTQNYSVLLLFIACFLTAQQAAAQIVVYTPTSTTGANGANNTSTNLTLGSGANSITG